VFFALLVTTIPKLTSGRLEPVARTSDGEPRLSRAKAAVPQSSASVEKERHLHGPAIYMGAESQD
jgi:hypothetical protein